MADETPYFPAPSPSATSDPAHAKALLGPVLDALAGVVDVDATDLDRRTPCEKFTVRELQDHVLGWLQLFAAAYLDPGRRTRRLDPAGYHAVDDPRPASQVVRDASADLNRAIDGGALAGRIVASESTMDGPALTAMVLGEYLVHGWDLASALGRPWRPSDEACDVAREFLEGTVVPEYRGPDGGFFDAEVAVPAQAGALDRLLGFAGRDPSWKPVSLSAG